MRLMFHSGGGGVMDCVRKCVRPLNIPTPVFSNFYIYSRRDLQAQAQGSRHCSPGGRAHVRRRFSPKRSTEQIVRARSAFEYAGGNF